MANNKICDEIGNCQNAWNCGFCHEVEKVGHHLSCPGYKPKRNI